MWVNKQALLFGGIGSTVYSYFHRNAFLFTISTISYSAIVQSYDDSRHIERYIDT